MADKYHQALQKRGQPLREGFAIVKVRAARVACMCSLPPAAHTSARFPDVLVHRLTLRRLHQPRMQVLAFLEC